MTTKASFLFFSLTALFLTSFLSAEIKGKVDIGPAYLSVDILESGKTEQTLSMGAVKGDATIAVWKGICIKPGFPKLIASAFIPVTIIFCDSIVTQGI